jgi:hypothetical protein
MKEGNKVIFIHDFFMGPAVVLPDPIAIGFIEGSSSVASADWRIRFLSAIKQSTIVFNLFFRSFIRRKRQTIPLMMQENRNA